MQSSYHEQHRKWAPALKWMFGVKLLRLCVRIHCQLCFPTKIRLVLSVVYFDLGLRRSQERLIWLWFWKHFFPPFSNRWFNSGWGVPHPTVFRGSGQIASGCCVPQIGSLRSCRITCLNAQLIGINISPSPSLFSLIFINSDKHSVSPKPLFLWQCIVHIGGRGATRWLTVPFDVLLASSGEVAPEGVPCEWAERRESLYPGWASLRACAPHTKCSLFMN